MYRYEVLSMWIGGEMPHLTSCSWGCFGGSCWGVRWLVSIELADCFANHHVVEAARWTVHCLV